MAGQLLQRSKEWRGVTGGNSCGLKVLSFSKREFPRGIRTRSVRTYFAIFSRHAISGMTNGGCVPFYQPSIIPSSFVHFGPSSFLSVLFVTLPLPSCSSLSSSRLPSMPLFRGSSSRMPFEKIDYQSLKRDESRQASLLGSAMRPVRRMRRAGVFHEFLNESAFPKHVSSRLL